jgi:hypothetical protein
MDHREADDSAFGSRPTSGRNRSIRAALRLRDGWKRLRGPGGTGRGRRAAITAVCLITLLGMGAAVSGAIVTLAGVGTGGAPHAPGVTPRQRVQVADQALAMALAGLRDDTQALGVSSHFNELYADYVQVRSLAQTDYLAAQGDAQNGCADAGQFHDAAGRFQADLQDMRADAATVHAQQSTIDAGIARVQADIESVQNAWQRLQRASAASPAAAAHVSAHDVDAALGQAQHQIKQATMARDYAAGAANNWKGEIDRFAAAAQQLTSAVACR